MRARSGGPPPPRPSASSTSTRTNSRLRSRGLEMGYLFDADRIHEDVWMVEYARGPVPLMLPFGLADACLSTLDFRTVGKTLMQYGKLAAREVLVHRKF